MVFGRTADKFEYAFKVLELAVEVPADFERCGEGEEHGLCLEDF